MLNSKYLGENIKRHRQALQMTQAQLAEKLFVSAQGISGWERGTINPDLSNLCRLATLFHVSVDSLLQNSGDENERMMIAIDGGGTKTELVLFTSAGHILHRLCLGRSNPNDIGVDACYALLTDGIDTLLRLTPGVSGVYAGIAGCGAGSCQKQLIARLNEKYPDLDVHVDSDVVNAFSLGDFSDNGMALISGTGSVLYVKSGGVFHRIGGWGYLFDEAGSAYDIGRDAVRAVLAERDGLGASTCLTDYLREQLGGDIWAHLDDLYRGGRTLIAGLSPLVFQGAKVGDAVSQTIIRKNMARLAELIRTADASYDCGSTVLLCGGVVEHHAEEVISLLSASLPQITFVTSHLPQIYGAVTECMKRMQLTMDGTFAETFQREYSEPESYEG